MQPNRQVLVWAGLGILVIAGLVAFTLIANQPQTRTGIAINILEAASGEASAVETEPAQPEEAATAEATEAPAEGDSATTEEATEGEDGGEFLTVDAENQTVILTVIASYDDTNGGLNFNGYADGEATFVVPEGWTVEVQYDNLSIRPHSAGVVSMELVNESQVPEEPAFEGAITENFISGLIGQESFSFTADEQGTYAIVCGVPGHASSGQWLVLEVGAPDVEPAFQTNDEPAE